MIKQALPWADMYEGTRSELISAGIAQATWFPVGRHADKRGRVKRTYTFEDKGRDIKLKDRGDHWTAYIGITETERRERERKSEKVKRAEDDREALEFIAERAAAANAKRAEDDRRLRRALDFRPDVTRDSLTADELQVIKLWRILNTDARYQGGALDTLKIHASALLGERGPRLSLVVSNS